MSILVKVSPKFIGYYICKNLLEIFGEIININNINYYHDISFKEKRLELIEKIKNEIDNIYKFINIHNKEETQIETIFKELKLTKIINVSEIDEVRFLIENTYRYIRSNLVNFANILKQFHINNIDYFIYHLIISVYGRNKKIYLLKNQSLEHSVSVYSSSIKLNKLITITLIKY